ncbi:MAG: hydrogenase maturation nickel metallochaperone HypA [Verrucomicrobiota bacterium]|nr:hydrogenase maturation nickel metallochaperone HypA [Verrucomicrobiota bacterium]
MHEFALCESLLAILLREMEGRGLGSARLVKARVAVGRLRQVVPEAFEAAYAALTRGTPAAGSVLKIRFIPIRLKCRDCGAESAVENWTFECPGCASVNVEVVNGRELHLESIEVDETPAGSS